jgi:alanine racemase
MLDNESSLVELRDLSMLYQTIAKIHLNNICYNIEGIRQAIGSERKILVAVKANGYGHGAVAVSRMA